MSGFDLSVTTMGLMCSFVLCMFRKVVGSHPASRVSFSHKKYIVAVSIETVAIVPIATASHGLCSCDYGRHIGPEWNQ